MNLGIKFAFTIAAHRLTFLLNQNLYSYPPERHYLCCLLEVGKVLTCICCLKIPYAKTFWKR